MITCLSFESWWKSYHRSVHYTGVDTNALQCPQLHLMLPVSSEGKRVITCLQMRKQTQRGEVMSPGSHSELMLEPELERHFQL